MVDIRHYIFSLLTSVRWVGVFKLLLAMLLVKLYSFLTLLMLILLLIIALLCVCTSGVWFSTNSAINMSVTTSSVVARARVKWVSAHDKVVKPTICTFFCNRFLFYLETSRSCYIFVMCYVATFRCICLIFAPSMNIENPYRAVLFLWIIIYIRRWIWMLLLFLLVLHRSASDCTLSNVCSTTASLVIS